MAFGGPGQASSFRDYVRRTILANAAPVPPAIGVPQTSDLRFYEQNTQLPARPPAVPSPHHPNLAGVTANPSDVAAIAALAALLRAQSTGPAPPPPPPPMDPATAAYLDRLDADRQAHAQPAQPAEPTPEQAAAIQAYLHQQQPGTPTSAPPPPTSHRTDVFMGEQLPQMSENEFKDAARKAQDYGQAAYRDYLAANPEAREREEAQRAADAVLNPIEPIVEHALDPIEAYAEYVSEPLRLGNQGAKAEDLYLVIKWSGVQTVEEAIAAGLIPADTPPEVQAALFDRGKYEYASPMPLQFQIEKFAGMPFPGFMAGWVPGAPMTAEQQAWADGLVAAYETGYTAFGDTGDTDPAGDPIIRAVAQFEPGARSAHEYLAGQSGWSQRLIYDLIGSPDNILLPVTGKVGAGVRASGAARGGVLGRAQQVVGGAIEAPNALLNVLPDALIAAPFRFAREAAEEIPGLRRAVRHLAGDAPSTAGDQAQFQTSDNLAQYDAATQPQGAPTTNIGGVPPPTGEPLQPALPATTTGTGPLLNPPGPTSPMGPFPAPGATYGPIVTPPPGMGYEPPLPALPQPPMVVNAAGDVIPAVQPDIPVTYPDLAVTPYADEFALPLPPGEATVVVGDRKLFQGRVIRTVGSDGTVRVKETTDGRWVVQEKVRGRWTDVDGAPTEQQALNRARRRVSSQVGAPIAQAAPGQPMGQQPFPETPPPDVTTAPEPGSAPAPTRLTDLDFSDLPEPMRPDAAPGTRVARGTGNVRTDRTLPEYVYQTIAPKDEAAAVAFLDRWQTASRQHVAEWEAFRAAHNLPDFSPEEALSTVRFYAEAELPLYQASFPDEPLPPFRWHYGARTWKAASNANQIEHVIWGSPATAKTALETLAARSANQTPRMIARVRQAIDLHNRYAETYGARAADLFGREKTFTAIPEADIPPLFRDQPPAAAPQASPFVASVPTGVRKAVRLPDGTIRTFDSEAERAAFVASVQAQPTTQPAAGVTQAPGPSAPPAAGWVDRRLAQVAQVNPATDSGYDRWRTMVNALSDAPSADVQVTRTLRTLAERGNNPIRQSATGKSVTLEVRSAPGAAGDAADRYLFVQVGDVTLEVGSRGKSSLGRDYRIHRPDGSVEQLPNGTLFPEAMARADAAAQTTLLHTGGVQEGIERATRPGALLRQGLPPDTVPPQVWNDLQSTFTTHKRFKDQTVLQVADTLTREAAADQALYRQLQAQGYEPALIAPGKQPTAPGKKPTTISLTRGGDPERLKALRSSPEWRKMSKAERDRLIAELTPEKITRASDLYDVRDPAEAMAGLAAKWHRYGDLDTAEPRALAREATAFARAVDVNPTHAQHLPLALDFLHMLVYRMPRHLLLADPLTSWGYTQRNMLSNVQLTLLGGGGRGVGVRDMIRAGRTPASSVAAEMDVALGFGQTPRELVRQGSKFDVSLPHAETPTRKLFRRLRLEWPAKPFDAKRGLDQGIERGMKIGGAYAPLVQANVAEAIDPFIDELIARAPRGTPISRDELRDAIWRVRDANGMFSPQQAETAVREALLRTGASDAAIRGMAAQARRRWVGAAKRARDDAITQTNRIFPAHRMTNLDRYANYTLLFHFWPTRAAKFVLEEMIRNPAIAAHWQRAQAGLERMAEENPNLSPTVKGMIYLANSPLGFALFANPSALFLVTALQPERAQYPDPEGMTWLGHQIQVLREKTGLSVVPFFDAVLNVTGVYGNTFTPDFFPSRTIELAGAAIDYIGIKTGNGPGSPWYETAKLRLREAASGILPGTQTIEAEDPNAILKDTMAHMVLEQDPDLRARVLSPDEATRIAARAEWAAILDNPDDPRYEAAEQAVAGQRLWTGALNAVAPLTTRARLPGRDELIAEARELRERRRAGEILTPAQQAIVEARGFATEADPMLVTEAEQYFDLGTERQRRLQAGWVDIAHGDWSNGDLVRVGGQLIPGRGLMAMSDDERSLLADQWVAEQDGTMELDAYRDLRSDFIAQHPTFAEYDEYRDLAFRAEGGVRAFRTTMARTHPEFRDELAERRDWLTRERGLTGEPLERELDQWVTSQAGYHAFQGEPHSIYDEAPAPAYDPTSDPYLGVHQPAVSARSSRGPKSAGDQLAEDVAAYEAKTRQMSAILGAPVDTYDNPLIRQALERQYGDQMPRVTKLMELYGQWAAVQPPGSDTSPAAFGRYMDQLEREAALGLAPAA